MNWIRTVAEQTMANRGQDEAASQLGLYAVASTYPVHALTTAYTAVMDARTGALHPFVRTSVCPIDDEQCGKEASPSGFGVQSSGGSTKDDSQDKHHNNIRHRKSNMAIHWAYAIMGALVVALIVMTSLFVNAKRNKSGAQYQPIP